MKKQHGFTLVELSIVLVILGLLVGGVLTGQSLIRAAELRSATADFQRYQAATYAFRDKYFALPGQLTNATAYWGKDNTDCPTATGTAASPGTCNGLGLTTYGTSVTTLDHLLYWQHLALAGMIEGTYRGMQASADNYVTFGGLYGPKSKISAAYYSFPRDITAGDIIQPANGAGQGQPATLTLGKAGTDPISGDTVYGAGGVLAMADAYNIDKKMDDGVANTGKINANIMDVISGDSVSGTCAAYTLTDTTSRCALSYQLFQ